MAAFWQNFIQDVISIVEDTISAFDFVSFLDILIVAFAVYQLIKLTQKTRANQLLKGVVVVLIFQGIALLIGLQTVKTLLAYIIGSGAVVFVVLFQPEIRAALERMGRGAKIDAILSGVEAEEDGGKITNELIHAINNLSRRKVGLLMVFEKQTGLNDVIATGTILNAVISSALVENIFEPNTPLHDGAVVIRGSKIAAAGCFLHLTEDKGLSRELGTRHRAAIGVTEMGDCISIIVSEETGVVSYAEGGKMTRYLDEAQLRGILTPLFGQRPERKLGPILRRKGNGDETK